MTRTKLTLALALCLALPFQLALAQEPPAEGVYIIFDGSGSMWGQLADGTHKIQAARQVLREFVAGDFGGRELALRVYGHNREGDCSDTELVEPFSATGEAVTRMQSFVDKVNPKGKTPISRSLRAALEDFGNRTGEIILISDGIETCDEDPCELMRAWREKNVQIRVHVVGLGLEEKERLAMQCISEAAGTEYQDAQSASDLSAGLARIQEVSGTIALKIVARTATGEAMQVEGTATPAAGGQSLEVASHRRNVIPAGRYDVTVGVRTRNGTLHRPVTQTVTVAEQGETTLTFVAEEPGSVSAKFLDRGKEIRGAQITAFRGDTEAFHFRWMDRVYVDAGTYTFSAKPDPENDLSVSATIADGKHTELAFEMVHTVRAVIKMVASTSEMAFRGHYELWQSGEKKYTVHSNNGVQALPGTYDVKLLNELTPHTHPGIVLTGEERQEFRIEVPAGHVTVIYQKADGTRNRDERIWLNRMLDGKVVGRPPLSRTGVKIPLTPGTYRLKGYDRMGDFDEITFEIAAGEDKEIVLRSKS